MSRSSGPSLDVISLGTLGRNLLWKEQAAKRTPHATTTLIVAGDRVIVVDPGLPPQVLAARFGERTNVSPAAVTDVFLTTLLPAHRDGAGLFENATVHAHEPELMAVAGHLKRLAQEAAAGGDGVPDALRRELAFLGTLRPAPDKLADGVDLFPLPGATPGTCGLLVTDRQRATLLAGPAVPTRGHLLAGQVLPESADVAAAKEALAEVYEIADAVVPGYDNLFNNPRAMLG